MRVCYAPVTKVKIKEKGLDKARRGGGGREREIPSLTSRRSRKARGFDNWLKYNTKETSEERMQKGTEEEAHDILKKRRKPEVFSSIKGSLRSDLILKLVRKHFGEDYFHSGIYSFFQVTFLSVSVCIKHYDTS